MAATDGCATACATTCEWFTATGLVAVPPATRRNDGDDDGCVTDGSMVAVAAPRWPAVVAGEATTGSAVWWTGTVRVVAKTREDAACAAGLGRGRLVRTGMARDEDGEEEEEEQEGWWWWRTTGALGSALTRTAWSRGCGGGCCWGADGAGTAVAAAEGAAAGGAVTRLPRRRLDEESLPPRNGGDREEQGEEDDDEEAGDCTSTSRGTHDDEKDDDDGEWGAVCGDARPKEEEAALFFLPRLGGRVNAGGLDFLRGFLGLGSEAILL